VNEISGRYSVMEPEFYDPAPEAVAGQSSNNKQGRDDQAVDPGTAEIVRREITDQHERSYREYQSLLDRGIARELARIDLPLSLYTQLYWQIDLHNLFHFLELRADSHAQYEIRCYARTMLDMVRRVCPIATEAFDEHVRDAVTFSGREHQVLLELLQGAGEDFSSICSRHGLGKKARERLAEKLGGMGGEEAGTAVPNPAESQGMKQERGTKQEEPRP
jgi:thymidylate synthase (FAD)